MTVPFCALVEQWASNPAFVEAYARMAKNERFIFRVAPQRLSSRLHAPQRPAQHRTAPQRF